jgi:hypothetical protein
MGGGGCAFCGVHARVVGRVVKSDDADGSGVLWVLLEVVADVSTTVLGNQQRLLETRVVERLPKGLGVRRVARPLVPNADVCGNGTTKVDGKWFSWGMSGDALVALLAWPMHRHTPHAHATLIAVHPHDSPTQRRTSANTSTSASTRRINRGFGGDTSNTRFEVPIVTVMQLTVNVDAIHVPGALEPLHDVRRRKVRVRKRRPTLLGASNPSGVRPAHTTARASGGDVAEPSAAVCDGGLAWAGLQETVYACMRYSGSPPTHANRL